MDYDVHHNVQRLQMNKQNLKSFIGLRSESCNSMAELRTEIDLLDRAIVDLISLRQTFMDQAAQIKKDRNRVRDEDRIRDVVIKVGNYAKDAGTDPDLVCDLYRKMIEWSINYEMKQFDKLNQV